MCETLTDLASLHKDPDKFMWAYCSLLAGWMEESGYRSGCPIATTMLETAPQSPVLAKAGEKVFDQWIAIIAQVFVESGMSPEAAELKSKIFVSAIEGALIASRVRQSSTPILNVARFYDQINAAPQKN